MDFNQISIQIPMRKNVSTTNNMEIDVDTFYHLIEWKKYSAIELAALYVVRRRKCLQKNVAKQISQLSLNFSFTLQSNFEQVLDKCVENVLQKYLKREDQRSFAECSKSLLIIRVVIFMSFGSLNLFFRLPREDMWKD